MAPLQTVKNARRAAGDPTTIAYGVLKVSRRGRLAYDRTIDSSR